MHNVFPSIKAWAPGFHERVGKVAKTEMMEHFLALYITRLTKDLNRIAEGRLGARSIDKVLTFTVTRTGLRELTIKPSDPVLFKSLEFGEFNDDGTLKTPPRSILGEWRAIVRT